MKSIDDNKPKPYQSDLPEQVFKRVMQYKGKTLNECRNPHVTAREAIALADYIDSLLDDVLRMAYDIDTYSQRESHAVFKKIDELTS